MFKSENFLNKLGWREHGLTYYKYSFYLKQYFGCRVQKVTLSSGLSCPNRDGTIGTEGCIFCDNESFAPAWKYQNESITNQINMQLVKMRKRYQTDKFLAYFQTGTNTHGPVAKLKTLFDEATCHPNIVGIIVGTRPDSISDEAVDLLARYHKEDFLVGVELGLQSIHEKSLRWMNRGHGPEVFFQAADKIIKHGIQVGAHIILGLPGESDDEMLETIAALNRAEINTLKIHNLHVIKNTPLERLFYENKICLYEKGEYLQLLLKIIKRLSPSIAVQRLVSDIPRKYLVAPEWTHEKDEFLSLFEKEMKERGIYQGQDLLDEKEMRSEG